MRRIIIIAVAALALVVGTAGAQNVAPTAAVIYGCQSTKGEVKIVSQSTLCSSLNSKQSGTWTVLNWNGTGIQGVKGDPGVDGIDGTNGTNGIDGTNGAPGADGTNGIDGTNGTDGLNGTNGTNGVSGYEVVTQSYTVNSHDPTGTATCPTGKVVIGGGIDGGYNSAIWVFQDYPVGQSWYVGLHNDGSLPTHFSVYAICATVG